MRLTTAPADAELVIAEEGTDRPCLRYSARVVDGSRIVDTLGWATRARAREWQVIVRGYQPSRCYRRRSAVRLLAQRARRVLNPSPPKRRSTMSKALSAQAHKRIRIASGIVAVILGVLVAMTVWPTSSHAAVPGPRSTPVPAPHGRAGSIVRTPQPNCLIPTTATDSDMSVGNGHVGFLPVTDLVYTLPNGGTIVVTETSDRLQAQYAASRGTLTYVCVNNATSN